MGMSLKIYIGAYMVFIPKGKIEELGPKKCKKHPNQGWHDDDSLFCPICGDALIRETVVRKVRWYDLFKEEKEGAEDDFRWIEDVGYKSDDNRQFFVVSEFEHGDLPDQIPNEIKYGDTAIEITPGKTNQYIENFKKNHAGVLAMLENKAETMIFKFGVVSYYS